MKSIHAQKAFDPETGRSVKPASHLAGLLLWLIGCLDVASGISASVNETRLSLSVT